MEISNEIKSEMEKKEFVVEIPMNAKITVVGAVNFRNDGLL
jgi:hypothetical protein